MEARQVRDEGCRVRASGNLQFPAGVNFGGDQIQKQATGVQDTEREVGGQ